MVTIIEQIKDYRIQGIYGIRNKINHKVYVGQASTGEYWATGIYNRLKQHRNELRNNIHGNSHLQNSWNKYGESNFEFLFLEEVECKSDLTSKEDFWMEKLKTRNPKHGYNFRTAYNSNKGLILKNIGNNNLMRAIKEYAERHNKLPNVTSGKVQLYYERGDEKIMTEMTWRQIDQSMRKGHCGFNGLSLKSYIKKKFKTFGMSIYNKEDVLGWIKVFVENNGKFPASNWRDTKVDKVPNTSHINKYDGNLNWKSINACFVRHYNTTLREFIKQEYKLVDISEELVIEWAKDYTKRTGEIPNRNSADLAIDTIFVIGKTMTWDAVDNHLRRYFNRTLKQVLEESEEYKLVDISEELVIEWAKDYTKRTGEIPKANSMDLAVDTIGRTMTWNAVDCYLRKHLNRNLKQVLNRD